MDNLRVAVVTELLKGEIPGFDHAGWQAMHRELQYVERILETARNDIGDGIKKIETLGEFIEKLKNEREQLISAMNKLRTL